jgi:hypothetical protein
LFTAFCLATGAVADDSFFTPEAKLTAEDDAAAEDQYGFSVAVKAGTMVVGAPYKDDACPTAEPSCNSGAVYLFKSEGNTWIPNRTTFKLTASDAVKGDQFGWSVAIDGDRLAVGAPSKNEGPPVSGAVYLFRYDGNGWLPDESQEKLTASIPKIYERFGFSLALDDDRLVVGAPGSNSAYVFDRQQDGKWLPADIPPLQTASMFGSAVAARNGRVAVGAPGSGLAFVLEGSSWVQLPAQAPFLGCSLAFHGDTVVVGAPSSMHPFVSATGAGSVHLFTLQGTTWVQEDVLELPYAGGFGSSVSSNGDTLVVGAPFDEAIHPVSQEVVQDAGSSYVFAYENNEWLVQTQLIAGDPQASDNPNAEPFVNDRFGWAVATDGNAVVAGAPFLNDVKLPNNAGAVYGFVLTSDNSAPTAHAEFYPDEVTEGDLVTLDGSFSSDPDNDPLTYQWAQKQSDHEILVELDLTDPMTPTFIAPELNPECASFAFTLTVKDDKGASSEPYIVEIPVKPNNEIHSTLGRKHRRRWWWPASFWHSYEFKGSEGERVTINLEKDARGWHRGNRATLILRDKIWGARLWKRKSGSLPNSITATLPADGEYKVYVIKRPWFRRGQGFTGDYVLTVEGTCGKVMK